MYFTMGKMDGYAGARMKCEDAREDVRVLEKAQVGMRVPGIEWENVGVSGPQ